MKHSFQYYSTLLITLLFCGIALAQKEKTELKVAAEKCISYSSLRIQSDQEQSNYISMIDSNNIWTSEKIGNHQAFRTSYKIKINKDSIVNDITFGKFSGGNLVKDFQKKIYLRVNENGKMVDKLFYDFSCSEKDSVIVWAGGYDSYIKGVVDSIRYEIFFGATRKVIYYNSTHWINKKVNQYTDTIWHSLSANLKGKNPHKWVEGIGNVWGDLFHQPIGEPFIMGWNGIPIICFESSGQLIYKRIGFESCEYLNRPLYLSSETAENATSNAVALYPNPVAEILTIKSIRRHTKLVVYQSNGVKVLESLATESLDVSTLPTGLYLLEATDEIGNRVIRKFEKK